MTHKNAPAVRGTALCALLLTASVARADTGTLSHLSVHPFQTDGCTLFPQGDYLACCVEHDYEYWEAQSWSDLVKADTRLFGCVWHRRRVVDKPAAALMWIGVKFGWITRFRPAGALKDLRPLFSSPKSRR
jgi:hypothetical protein